MSKIFIPRAISDGFPKDKKKTYPAFFCPDLTRYHVQKMGELKWDKTYWKFTFEKKGYNVSTFQDQHTQYYWLDQVDLEQLLNEFGNFSLSKGKGMKHSNDVAKFVDQFITEKNLF